MFKKILSNKLFLVLALATFLRLFLLGRIPVSLNWDEISMGYTAYSVAETGKDEWGQSLPVFFRSYGEWKSAVYIYLLVPLVKFFGMNAWTVRLPSALAGILTVYLTYLIGRKLYSEKVALWSAFFMAVMPWSFVLSRPAFEANVSLTLIIAGIHFFLEFNLKPKTYMLLASAISFGLAPHTYNSAKVVVPFLVLYLVWQSKFYKNLKLTAVYFVILALFALPILTGFVTGQSQKRFAQVGINTNLNALNSFVDNRKSIDNPFIGKVIFNKYTYATYASFKNWFSYFDPAFLVVEAGDHKQHHVPYRGVLYFTQFIFIMYGLLELKKGNRLPLVLIGLGLLPAALTRDNHHVLRTILTTPGWALLSGIGIVSWKIAVPNRSLWRRWVICLLIIEVISFMLMYFTWYPKYTTSDWQSGYQEVASYLAKHESEYDRIVMTKWYGEPQLFLAFYNKWDPIWFQSENIKNLHYEGDGKIWLDQLTSYGIGKYTYKYINWQNDQNDTGTLYIGKPDDFYADSNILETIYDQAGKPVFFIVKP